MGSGPTLIVIPARLESTRLPYKPLVQIGNRMLVEHVWRRAMESGIGPVWVSTDSSRIVDHLHGIGGNALYRAKISEICGTDRVFDLVRELDPDRSFSRVINLQGDMPFVSKRILRAVNDAISDEHPFVTVKCSTKHVAVGGGYFARFQMDQHVGVYGFTRKALDEWPSLPISFNERRERLEQFRVCDSGREWHLVETDIMPLEINTPEDLKAAQDIADCLLDRNEHKLSESPRACD